MDTRQTIGDFQAPLARHVAFDKSFKWFGVALDSGFSIFESETGELHTEQELERAIDIATVLEESQIIGLVGTGNTEEKWNQRLTLWDTNKQKEVAAIKVGSNIVGVQLSRTHIAVVFERGMNLYRHQPRIEKLATFESSSNPLGLCRLGTKVAALPGRAAGHIQIVDLKTLKVDIIPAHASALRALTLSPDNELIASASAKGTLVRIHSSSTCARLSELRRGVTTAIIHSLAISPSGTRLAVTSDTNTLHLFDLPRAIDPKDRSKSPSPADGGGSSTSSSTSVFNVQKWGGLARLPFAPRIFTDVYSVVSTTFDPGKEDDVQVWPVSDQPSSSGGTDEALKKVWPVKGVAGWIDEQTLVVISAGRDARYERFAVTDDVQGNTTVLRVGWSRYLRPN